MENTQFIRKFTHLSWVFTDEQFYKILIYNLLTNIFDDRTNITIKPIYSL